MARPSLRYQDLPLADAGLLLGHPADTGAAAGADAAAAEPDRSALLGRKRGHDDDADKPVKPKGKPGRKPKKTTLAAAAAATAAAAAAGDADTDASEVENDGQLYCLCRGKDDGQFMLECSGCQIWMHGHCVGLETQAKQDAAAAMANWYCPLCAVDPPTKPAKKARS